jgi:hypothetical protein
MGIQRDIWCHPLDAVTCGTGKERWRMLTDEQIIKALETIEYEYSTFDTDQTPLVYMRVENAKAILDLIKRQQAEIYNLKEDLSEYRNMPILTKNDCLIATVEKRADGKQYHNAFLTIKVDEIRAEAKSEAYKKITESVKAHMCSYDLDNYHSFRAIEEEAFDDLVKELTEGSK